jgi:hypothetical protein
MLINWKLTKKRGNFRPVLEYSIKLEDFEKELAVDQVVLESLIPEPPGSCFFSCLPGEYERGNGECGVYRIYTPDHKKAFAEGKLVLPWREDGSFPEIEKSFLLLRENFEIKLKEAYDSLPIEETGSLELSAKTRNYLASGLISKKILESSLL